MSKQEYYEYCFECEYSGEIPMSYVDWSGMFGQAAQGN